LVVPRLLERALATLDVDVATEPRFLLPLSLDRESAGVDSEVQRLHGVSGLAETGLDLDSRCC